MSWTAPASDGGSAIDGYTVTYRRPTARILDVYSHALLEDRVGGEESACRRLLEVMGATDAADVGTNIESIVGFFVDDPRFAGSVVRSLEAMWENARGAREDARTGEPASSRRAGGRAALPSP